MDHFIKYNPRQAISSIRNILNANIRDNIEYKNIIPKPDNMNYTDYYKVDVCALSVDIRGSSQMPQYYPSEIALAKTYRAYISEVMRIMQSCSLHRYFSITGDAVLGVFTIPSARKKELIPIIFKLGCMINTLINALNNELQKKSYRPIKVGIGMAYGNVLMVKAGQKGTGNYDYIFMGDAVNRASKLCNEGNKNGNEPLMIDRSISQFLSQTYLDLNLLQWNSMQSCYHGNLISKYEESIFNEKQNFSKSPLQENLLRKILSGNKPVFPTIFNSVNIDNN